ncbi:calcium-binding protein [Actinoplanes sp. NPDC051851]|uniref:calcium-binding protein n=1 Tax=Actinoplanes sp. NPDC051851 TaxID=3154753 RepID=UPI0034238857
MSRSPWLVRAGVTLLGPLTLGVVAVPAQAASAAVVKVTTDSAGARVRYTAAAGARNSVSVSLSGTKLVIDDRVAVKAGKGCKAVKGDKTRVICSASRAWASINISLGSGDDVLVDKTAIRLVADGGSGTDRIVGGRGDDSITGGAGNDTLSGGYGSDRVYGNAGHDTLSGDEGPDVVDGGSGNDRVTGDGHVYDVAVWWPDTLRGASGFDTLYYQEGAETIAVDLNGTAANTPVNESDAVDGTFEGAQASAGSGPVIFTGNAADNVFVGSGYLDTTMYGRAGDDTLTTYDGGAKLYGGAGHDTLTVKAWSGTPAGDANLLDGGDGADRCVTPFPDRDTRSGCER